MSLLDSIKGALSPEIMGAVNTMLERQGGLAGLANQFEAQGLGSKFRSWIGNGENAPISTDEIERVLGSETLQRLAAKLGISPEELAEKLSRFLPNAVDKMTPNGTLPQDKERPDEEEDEDQDKEDQDKGKGAPSDEDQDADDDDEKAPRR